MPENIEKVSLIPKETSHKGTIHASPHHLLVKPAYSRPSREHLAFLLSPFRLAPNPDLVGTRLALLLSPFRTDPLFRGSVIPFHSLYGFIPLEPVVHHQDTLLVISFSLVSIQLAEKSSSQSLVSCSSCIPCSLGLTLVHPAGCPRYP